MMNKKQFHYLYYSNYCDNSAYLILKLANLRLLPLFNLICIDRSDSKGVDMSTIPETLVAVPCVITTDYDFPLLSDSIDRWLDFKRLQIIKNSQQRHIEEARRFSRLPVFQGSTDSNIRSKKQTLEDFEMLQKLREEDDAKFVLNAGPAGV